MFQIGNNMKFLTLVHFTEDEIKRLKLAEFLNDWGHLSTWKELLTFQSFSARKKDHSTVRSIGYIAGTHNNGEFISLPYDDTVARKYMVKCILKRLHTALAVKENKQKGGEV